MNEAYLVNWSASAARAMNQRIPTKAVMAIAEFATGPLAQNPFRVGKPLAPPLAPQYSARRGEYRVIYLIDHNHQIVTITAVAHRRDAYRTS